MNHIHSKQPSRPNVRPCWPIGSLIAPLGRQSVSLKKDKQWVAIASRHILHQKHCFQIPQSNNQNKVAMQRMHCLPATPCPWLVTKCIKMFQNIYYDNI